ncbi:SDR family NAD(P)-dependent oxidoreductase [Novosphingobium colocasiae]
MTGLKTRDGGWPRSAGTPSSARGDVTDDAFCECAVAETVKRFGRVDLLVNNVGIVGPTGRLDALDMDLWDRVIDVNLRSALLMARHAIPAMQAGGKGAIVNISSIAGIRAHGSLAYGPSKAALSHLSAELAVLYGPDGIRVNAVVPGHIHTPP